MIISTVGLGCRSPGVLATTNTELAIANACYFNIGARLARYTNNDTYADKASDVFDVLLRLGYIDKDWNVFDGAHLPDCTEINKAQFSYNAAMLMQGAAFMYNHVRYLCHLLPPTTLMC